MTAGSVGSIAPPGHAELEAVFELKYGGPGGLGWGPAMRRRAGYFNPDDHYEALVRALVGPATRWLDVGCGRELFPSNRPLAAELAGRCRRLVGIDPDPTLDENPFVHERVRAPIDDYRPAEPFELVTMRMVAEHVDDPPAVCATLARCVAPGGLLVVYTVDGCSPAPLLTRLWPFALRHPVKRWLWRTEERDTFPTRFRMNSRRRLRALLDAAGFDEALFVRLDDCRTFGRFRTGLRAELAFRRLLRAVALPYPERCLLGAYRRRS